MGGSGVCWRLESGVLVPYWGSELRRGPCVSVSPRILMNFGVDYEKLVGQGRRKRDASFHPLGFEAPSLIQNDVTWSLK